ncbi:mitochondrial import inner membrane translocase subunit Tim54 [Hypoxylon sp. NC1633]|nr:mitochondrial import inner membrane translocase subunit Tim54 [Hypoxylon sp. NC1633]
MTEPTPPSAPGAAAPVTAPSAAPAASMGADYKARKPNPAFRMMGIPVLPRKLPSRNWMIFLTITGSLSAAIIYDKREKKRATARWSKAVSHLAAEPLTNPHQLPRKLTIFLESPPGDGLRVAQDHFTEYVKPVLAASGLDWEFVQGRKEGDVRAAVAERIRRTRQSETGTQTQDEIVQQMRKANNTPEWQGIRGDIVIGRHTWKEYIRGLHEGWLGPLTAPASPSPSPSLTPEVDVKEVKETNTTEGNEAEKQESKPNEKPEKKSERPPQPPPYNTTNDYPTSALPMLIPAEFSPSAPIPFPHVLGFSNTLIRLRRFFNRRYLADDIGREVAAVCLAAAREYSEDVDLTRAEQQTALEHEERDWNKSVWKEDEPKSKENKDDASSSTADAVTPGTTDPSVPTEKIWKNPVVLDPRIAMRMRRFEVEPEEETRAKSIQVPEEEIEGWIKGSFRALYHWTVSKPKPNPSWPDEE